MTSRTNARRGVRDAMIELENQMKSAPLTLRFFIAQVVLLGEGRVGKTSLLVRFVQSTFDESQAPTVRASYLTKTVRLESDARATLNVWDTAGQERFHALGPIYYRDADAAIVVYDITDADSFERAKAWVKELRRIAGAEISIAVCANKSDLERARRVSNDDGEAYAKGIGASFHSTSAKTDKGVEQAFMSVARALDMKRGKSPVPAGSSGVLRSRSLKIAAEEETKPKGTFGDCC